MRAGTLRMKTARLFVAVLALLAGVVAAARSGVAGKGEEEKLGTVSFGTSCSEDAQPQFNRAVALLHSFQFGPAIEGFNGVLAGDKTCAMAYWGIALSDWGNPFAAGLKAPGQLEKGWKAVEQGRAAAPKTERERAYIEAVAHLYADTGKFDQRARKLQYEDAMESLNAAYPTDTEGAIFYALALAAAADPADKSYAKQIKAGGILENLFVQYPDHPGLAHYIIHAYDVPPLAGKAVGAAKRYGEIAPSTPHALHMPSHTFTRTGDWQASINSNIASAAVAQRSGQPVDQLHASDYLVYAYLQKAEDGAATESGEWVGRNICEGGNGGGSERSGKFFGGVFCASGDAGEVCAGAAGLGGGGKVGGGEESVSVHRGDYVFCTRGGSGVPER